LRFSKGNKRTLLPLSLIHNQQAYAQENRVRIEGSIVAVERRQQMITGLNVELEDFNANCGTNAHAVLVKIGTHAEVHSVGESDRVFFVPESKVVA